MEESARDLLNRWLAKTGKRHAVRRYLHRLTKQLLDDYGHGGPYTPKQVQSSVERAKLSMRFCEYAEAIFCDPDELKRLPDWHRCEDLRGEVGSSFLGMGGAGSDFSYADVTSYVSSHSDGHGGGYAGYADGHGDGGSGGHDGGVGGGGH